jgi:hypothetical protein
MRKIFAIGTLLLSSAAVFASPAAAYDRNTNHAYSNTNHVYSAPAPTPVNWSGRDNFDRNEKARIERERLERERQERLRHDVRYERNVVSVRRGC